MTVITVTEMTTVTKVVERSEHSAVHLLDGDAISTHTSPKEPFQTGCQKYASDQF